VSVTTVEALASIRARLTANFSTITVLWDGDNNLAAVPTPPTPWAFMRFVVDPESFLAHGGGATNNDWLNEGYIEAAVMTDVIGGAAAGMTYAESIAAVFRGQIFDGVTCMAATISSDGEKDEEGLYRITFLMIDLKFHRRA
jgi:hypothetical protein